MRTIHKSIFYILALLPLFFFSCTDEDNTEYNKGNQPLKLSSTSEAINLDVFLADVTAVTFEWTSGTNHGTNAPISYTFQLGVKGSDFKQGVSIDLGKAELFKIYTHKGLNSLLIDTLGLAPNVEVELEVRVLAAVVGQPQFATESTNILTVKATPYIPVTSTLYLIGSATQNGWDTNKATAMIADRSTPGSFTWQGHIKSGSLKFITTLGAFAPSYNKGDNDYTLYYRETENDPYDELFNFTASTAGIYRITLNVITRAVKFEKLANVEFSELWFVGDATSWNFKPMVADSKDANIFYFNSTLPISGSFKIATETNFKDETVYFRPLVDGTGVGENQTVQKYAGNPDNKWTLSAGTYKIKLNIKTLKIDIVSFTPYSQIWMVGSASPAGWDINNPTPLTPTSDVNVFKYSGPLTIDSSVGYGEFKFPIAKGDWNTNYFMPSSNWEGIDSKRMIFVKGGSPDNKWKITESGNYTITINQLEETISIVKN